MAVQTVRLVEEGGQPVSGGVGLEGSIIAALCGVLIAQAFAAWLGHRFNRCDAESNAFHHAFKSGMTARRKASRYAAAIWTEIREIHPDPEGASSTR